MLQWKKTKIITIVHQAEDYTITETPGADEPFRLDCVRDLDDKPTYFSKLDEAKRHAATLNALELERQENLRLRAELKKIQGSYAPEGVTPGGAVINHFLPRQSVEVPDPWFASLAAKQIGGSMHDDSPIAAG